MVTPVPIGSDVAAGNVSVAGVLFQREYFSGRERVAVGARLTNRGASPVEGLDVSLEMDGRPVETLTADLPANGSLTVDFAPVTLTDARMPGAVRVAADALPADDVFYFVIAPGQVVTVLLVGSERAAPEASLYLTEALGIGSSPAFDVRATTLAAFEAGDLDGRQVVVLNDTGPPPGEAGRALAAWVEAGGGLLVVAGERSAWPADGPDLLPGAVGSPEDRAGRGGALGFVDYSHPVFEVFGAPRSGDVTTARFFRHRPVEPHPEAVTLARFDDGQPALLERGVGRGSVLLWASGIDAFWNDLAKKPVYLPFVHRLVEHLADYRPPTPWFAAGQVLNLTEQEVALGAGGLAEAEYVAMSPSGRRIPVSAGARAGFIDLDEQGLYEVHDAAAAVGQPLVLAVNVDLAESDLTAVDPRGAGQHPDRPRGPGSGRGRPGARGQRRGPGAPPVGLVVPPGGRVPVPGRRDRGLEPPVAHRPQRRLTPASRRLRFCSAPNPILSGVRSVPTVQPPAETGQNSPTSPPTVARRLPSRPAVLQPPAPLDGAASRRTARRPTAPPSPARAGSSPSQVLTRRYASVMMAATRTGKIRLSVQREAESMRNEPLLTGDRNEVLRAVRHVRNRWRLRVALRGIAVLLAAALGTLLASSYGLELFRFDPNAIVGFRIATYLVLLGAGWWLFVRPVSRRVSDERVALYIEEHEPSLKTTVVSAVEESRRGEREAAADHSPELVRRLIASAVARIRDIDMGRGVEQGSLRRSSGLVLAAGVAAVLLFVFGPAYLRHGISALLTPDGKRRGGQPLPDRGVARRAPRSRGGRIRQSRRSSSASRRRKSIC